MPLDKMLELQEEGELFVVAQSVREGDRLGEFVVEPFSRIDDGFVAVSDPMMLADAMKLFSEVINGAA